MKNGRKLLSIILVLCMVMQILPVFATETEGTETTAPVAVNRVIDNQFNSADDTEGWEVGAVKANTYKATVDQGDAPDGTKGMLIINSTSSCGNDGGQEPNIIKKFGENKITFAEGKQVVVKTRFMQTGNGAETPVGTTYLRFNQPDNAGLLSSNNISSATYPKMTSLPINNANSVCDWFTLLKAENTGLAYRTANGGEWAPTAFASNVTTIGKWIDATITINKDQTYSISATVDGTTYTKDNGSLIYSGNGPQISYALYNNPEATEAISAYPSLDSLTWVTHTANNTVYVDYVEVYELTPYTATATVANTVDMDKAIEVNFTTEDDVTINEIPKGAVAIKGVKATESFDAGKLTLTPENGFEAGVTYTVTVDKTKLAELGMTYEGAEEFKVLAKDTSNGSVKMIINDQFNTAGDTGNWKVGKVKADTYKATLSQQDGALVMHSDNGVGSNGGQEPNVVYEFPEKIAFAEEKQVVIKTRFKQSGNNAETPVGLTYLRFNQPDNQNLLSGDDISSTSYPYMTTTINNANSVCDWFTLLKAGTNNDNNGLAYRTANGGAWAPKTFANGVNTVDVWMDATITINHDQTYTMSVNLDGTTHKVTDGSLIYTGRGPQISYTLYNNPEATEAISAYPSLDSLTWVTHKAQDVYVDYVQVYEVTPYSAYANAVGGSSVDKDGAFEFKFTSTTEGVNVTSIPAGTVTVDGVTVTESFNADTQTLSLKPTTALTEGNTYKVTINKAKLADVGMTYTGTEEFNIRARGARSTGVVLNDNFANGTEGWVVGEAQEGFKADALVVVDDTGAVDGKALKLVLPKQDTSVGKSSNYGTVTKAVGNGIEFKEGKTVTLETRIKKTSADVGYNLRINRPNTLAQVSTDYDYKTHYMVLGYSVTSNYPGAIAIDALSGNDVEFNNIRWATSSNNKAEYGIVDKWVTYKLVFTPSDGKYYITMSYTKEDGTEQSIITDRGALMKAAKDVIDKEYGTGYYNASVAKDAYDANNFFKSLDSITFSAPESGGEILVDYVKVYEESSISATVENGGSVEVGSPFELKITDANNAAAKVGAVPTDAFSVEGVETTNSYNAETQILSLTPETALAEGTTYKINVDTAKLAEVGVTYKGATQLRVIANNTAATGVRMIVNDQFNTEGDTEGWVKGAVKGGTSAFTVSQGTVPDGTEKALILHAEGGSSRAAGYQPNVYKAFSGKIDFNADKKLVIKTKFKHTGNGEGAGSAFLKFNQPNTTAFASTDDISWYWSNTLGRTDTIPSINGANAICGWFELLNANESKLTYMAKGNQGAWGDSTYSGVNTLNQWVEATITINGSEDITISAKIGDAEGETVNGTLHQDFTGPRAAYTLYNDKNATQWIEKFTSLDSLTWQTETKNDIYVDYVQIYEVELNTAKAQLLNGTKIEEGDAFKLQFMASRAVTEADVADAVSVTGVDVTKTFDAETQTLTLTPDAVTAGNAYTVVIDKDALENNGIDYAGTTTFNVKGIAKRITDDGAVYTTNFEDGIGTWKAGKANDGYQATVEPGTDDTNKVLKVTLPKVGDDTTGGKQSLAHFELPTGIKYEEGKLVVVKARVKNTTNTPYMIKFNRPDSLTQAENIRQLNGYMLVGQTANNGVMGLEFGGASLYTYANGNQWKPTHLFDYDMNKNGFSFANVDLTNKWVDWEIVLDGTTNKMNVVAKFDDTVLTTWSTKNPASAIPVAQALNAEYGKGTDIKTFNGLDSISITSYDTANDGVLYIDDVSVEVIRDRANLKNVKFTVGGEEVETVMAGDIVIPKYTVDPVISDTYKAITAMYVDGILTQMQVEDIKSENTYEETITGEIGFEVPTEGDVVIKAFLWDNMDTFEPLGAAGSVKKDDLTIYVDANATDGTGESGSLVATLSEALTVAEAKKTDGYTGGIRIEMAAGTYAPATVTSASVPAGGLVITKAEGEAPVISNGTEIDIANATQVTENTILDRISSADAKSNLYVVDLGNIKPEESWPGKKSFGVEALSGNEAVTDTGYLVSFNGQLMTNARWPNTGYEMAGTVGGNTASATDDNVANGFTVGTTNDKTWANPTDALITGFFGNGWALQTTPVASKANGVITSKYASRYGVNATFAKYYVYNLLEEIDTPYEYYIDRSGETYKMYFYKPADVTTGKITFALNKNELLTLSSVSNVTVDGLTFANTLGTALKISQGNNNKIKNCEFKHIAADIDDEDATTTGETNNAVIDIFSKNTVFDNNHIHDTNGGIKVGNDEIAEDMKHFRDANNVISNNHIEKYAVVDRVYVDAVNCTGMGNKVLNNEIHNAEHWAVRASGHNHLIQYNNIYDVCQQTEDAGAIYMGASWTQRGNKILNNYIHDINTTYDGNVTSVNHVAGIFVDDHFAGAHIEGNIFADIKGDGVRSNRGREHYIHNNLFVNCTRHGVALSVLSSADSVTTSGSYSKYLTGVKSFRETVGTYTAEIQTKWKTAFPGLFNTEDNDWAKPEKFTVTNNIAVNTLTGWDGKCLSAGEWIESLATKIENNEIRTENPGFANIGSDYTIDIAALQEIVPDFVDVQFAKMGRNK